MQPQQVQHHRADDRQALGDGDAWANAVVLHVVGDDRVAFGQAEGRDAEIREDAVEQLRDEEEQDDEIAKRLLAEQAGEGGLCD